MRILRLFGKIHLALLILWCLDGCMVWPVMTENHGYRPIEMGKRDQVFFPEASRPTELSSDFGHSYQMAIENQIVNPDAGNNLEPVVGLDGPSGAKAMHRYQKFFDKPPFDSKKGGGKK